MVYINSRAYEPRDSEIARMDYYRSSIYSYLYAESTPEKIYDSSRKSTLVAYTYIYLSLKNRKILRGGGTSVGLSPHVYIWMHVRSMTTYVCFSQCVYMRVYLCVHDDILSRESRGRGSRTWKSGLSRVSSALLSLFRVVYFYCGLFLLSFSVLFYFRARRYRWKTKEEKFSRRFDCGRRIREEARIKAFSKLEGSRVSIGVW